MKKFILIMIATVTFFATPVLAQSWNVDDGGIISSGSNAVIKGYDPVSYFTDGKAVMGDSKFSSAFQNGVFHFSSEKNKTLFDANPAKYAPQYGGYCAYAVAKNDTADIDPQAWKIVNGKLFLNYSPSVQKLWEEDVSGYISKADTNWPALAKKQ